MKIKDLPKIERPREKLVAMGTENLKDEELLAILLGTGTEGKNVIEVAEQILERRKEIEQDIIDLLSRAESDFTLDDVKEVIYNEEDQDDLTKAISMFDTGKIPDELENILELTNDAWNYFPHNILKGLSPAEKILEYQNKNK